MQQTADPTVQETSLLFDDAVADADPITEIFDEGELMFELGLWLSGIESFLRQADHRYIDTSRIDRRTQDHTREIKLVHTTLIRCSRLNFRLRRSLKSAKSSKFAAFTAEQSDNLNDMLRSPILLGEGLIAAGGADFGNWAAWRKTLGEIIASSPETKVLIRFAESSGDAFLPPPLGDLLRGHPLPFADNAELEAILPKFARVLKWLSVVGRMLRNDEPLKPALLIFSRIREQTAELIEHIDRQLSRYPDEAAELFGSLDGASYTAALELKKVFNQELSDVANIRPAPSVYARMETAYSLLNDSFQQIVAGFARLADNRLTALDLYPNFRIKLDQSLLLRDDLARVSRIVQRAEKDPEAAVLAELKSDLSNLLGNTMRYLFYKDRETIERFGEEIFAAGDKKDLGPILHRFGAYLETLFGQVNMRSVLAEHPYEDK